MLMMLSRAVRRVPLDWQHPKDGEHYRPLLAGRYAERLAEFAAGKAAWDRGEFPDYASDESRTMTFEEWHGDRPCEDDYMPAFTDWPPIGICMYEEVTEGTPISPVYEDTGDGRRAMAEYLAATPRGIEGGMTAADWLAIIEGGWGTKDIHSGDFEVRGGPA